jgi:sulfite reductase (NADPH) flavoprotein alpha-component
MKIIYATQTGNSEELAEQLGKSLNITPVSIADIDLDDLQNETCMFILSTWGEGEPPDDGERFLDEIASSDKDLSAMSYSICGLGDDSYEIFCGFAKETDKYLSQLGANRFSENVYCNVDYEDEFQSWSSNVISTLVNKNPTNRSDSDKEKISLLIDDLKIINNRVKEWEWKWPNIQIEALIRALHRKQ